MKSSRAILVSLLVCVLSAQWALARGKPLAQRIDAILTEPEAVHGFWGIQVVSLSSGKVLFEQNADKLFTPASITKLFTTSAVLALIGPDYRFKTTVETAGIVDKHGRVTGDLVLVGRGDPNLSGRTLPYNIRTERKLPPASVLAELADELVRKGVKYIDGDIVADDTFFASERYGEGWSQEDLVWGVGAPVSALTINDNVMFVNILPADRPGEKAFVSVEPYANYYTIDNRILTTPTGTGPRKFVFARQPGSRVLTLWGNIPVDDPGGGEGLAIDDPADFAAQLFQDMLEQRGITVYGKTRTRHMELANLENLSVTAFASGGGRTNGSNQALVLAQHQSQPLLDDLTVVNKVSQNLHAELMLRLLGREKGTAGTVESGLEVERGFLTQVGIGRDEYALYDGSGMSRLNLATPASVVKLLQYADKQPWGATLAGTLPVAGTDGSMIDRLKGTAAEGRVKAKTGTLTHVTALAGYATNSNGERVAFSIFCNNHTLSTRRAQELIDRIVLAVVEDQAGKK